MKKAKRITAMIITAVMALSVPCMYAFAEESIPSSSQSSEDMTADESYENYADSVKKIICKCAQKEYLERTGDAASNTIFSYIDGTEDASITLTDENGETLEVYTVNVKTGVGKKRNGDAVDLSEYVESIPEEEYFISSDYISDVARKYYKEKNGISASGVMMITDMESGTLNITLSDYEDNPLAVYTIDARTGIGTDSNGNAVDLSVYSDYKPVEEADYFITTNIMDEAALGYFAEQTGKEASGVMIIYDNSEPSAKIEIYSEDDITLDIYIIDPTTGIGTNSKGEAVDLAEYANTHEIVDSNPFIEVYESEYFASTDDIMSYVKSEYLKQNGKEASGVSMFVDSETMTAEIELYGENDDILDKYIIDVRTGIGTNQNTEAIDLSVYCEQSPNGERISSHVMNAYCGLVKLDYRIKTDNEAANASMEMSEGSRDAIVTLTDENDKVLDIYTFNIDTGIGINKNGDSIDLTANLPKEDDYFIKFDYIGDAAAQYYYKQTGIEASGSSTELDTSTAMLKIKLFNDGYAVIAEYVIDPKTGKGNDSKGETVDMSIYSDYEPLDESKFFAPIEEIGNMAKVNYEKNGKTCDSTEIKLNSFEQTAVITLKNTDDNQLNVYTIDPYTGIGKDIDNVIVNLPQTGMPSTHRAVAGLAALMTLAGIGLIRKSRKNDSE